MTRLIEVCTKGECIDSKQSHEMLEYLKRKRELLPAEEQFDIKEVDCLHVCHSGPVARVLPEGTIYHSLDTSKLDLIIDYHLKNGKVIEEYAFHDMDQEIDDFLNGKIF